MTTISKHSHIYLTILFFWALTGLILPNVILSVTEHMSAMQRIANVLLPLGLYWLALASQRSTGKAVLWLFPFTFLAAFQLVLLNLYGRSVIAVDMFMNVATTNSSEVGELLGNMIPAMLQVTVIYLAPLILAIVAVARKWRVTDSFRRPQLRISCGVAAAGALSFLLSFFVGNRPYAPQRDLFPVNAVYNAMIAVDRCHQSADYATTSGGYHFGSIATHPDSIPEIYILVVGETSRAENWQLAGYRRHTNPVLSHSGSIVFYPHTLSESNTTHKSVPMLLSALDARTFNDSINRVKSVITAFKEAGFHTAFLSAQQPNGSYIDFFGKEADRCEFLCELNDSTRRMPDRDALLLPALDEQLATRHRKELIVLHTYGSHYNYADRYDSRFRRFTPDSPIGAERKHRRELINAYDNTIVKTDWLLASVIGRLDSIGIPAAMLYTSDHGEDIFDDNRNLFLHASPIPSVHQIHVPFVAWVSDSYGALFPACKEALAGNSGCNVSSSRSFFHTALHLAGVMAGVFDECESLASSAYTEPDRLYLSDHNRPVRFTDGYLNRSEMQYLTTNGITTE